MRGVFLSFGGQKKIEKKFEKYFSNRKKNLKKFEKVEKTGIIATKFSLRCTPSVILGIAPKNG